MTTLEETVAALDEQAGGSESAPALPSGRDDTNKGAGPGESQAGDSDDEAAIELLGREAYDAVKADPKKLSKALHKSYTTKTQALAQQRDFIESWKSNPEATLQKMAEQYGYALNPKKGESEELTEKITADLSAVLGEEATSGMTKLIETIVQKVVDEKVSPVIKNQEQQEIEAALKQTDALFERLDAKYGKEWRELEAKMEEIGKQVQPNGMDPFKYMELLLREAKADTAVADAVDKKIGQIRKSAINSERATPGVKPAHIANVPIGSNGKLTFEDAWKAARAGKVIDPDEARRVKREARQGR